jgi:trimethylamine--corrinoid protein Co-methyltransferase
MQPFESISTGGSILFRRLNEAQLRDIHLATLEILERTGVRLEDERAVSILKKAGATVTAGNLVRIPGYLVDWAIRTAPKSIPLYDRDASKRMTLQGHRSYFGPGSDCVHALDHRTGERRHGVLQDVVEGTRVCDALDNIDYVMSMFIPSDVPVPISDRLQIEAMLLNTTKPVVFVTHDLAGCRDGVEMAEIIVGGAETLRLNPLVCCFINFDAPLRHNREALQKLMFMAEKGLPCIYAGSLTTRGILTPVTMAATLALVNAGQLVGLVLAQLIREGTPVICCRTGGGGIDMRTMVPLYASPEARGFRADLAHYYGLPTFGLAGCSDAKALDEQAMAEVSMTLLVDTLAGANLVHDVGYLESGLTYSLELLVMCDEIIGWIRRFMTPADVNDETLALDVIHGAGPGGQFLDTRHTVRHYREEWYPELMDRDRYDNWHAAGAKTFRERAQERIGELLKAHPVPPLDEETRQKVRAVVQRAADQAGVVLPT